MHTLIFAELRASRGTSEFLRVVFYILASSMHITSYFFIYFLLLLIQRAFEHRTEHGEPAARRPAAVAVGAVAGRAVGAVAGPAGSLRMDPPPPGDGDPPHGSGVGPGFATDSGAFSRDPPLGGFIFVFVFVSVFQNIQLWCGFIFVFV